MDFENFILNLTSISPNSKCLEFLVWRIAQDDYRGVHKFQHYRYDIDKVITFLNVLSRYERLYHSSGDVNDNYIYPQKELNFSDFVNEIKQKLDVGTNNSIRKNWFPDLQRLGFIDRYDENNNLCNVGERYRYRYVQISQLGIDFLNSPFQSEIFSNQIIQLFDEFYNDIRCVILQLDYLNIYEFMFFVSYIGKEIQSQNKTLASNDIVNLINDYRKLNGYQFSVVDIVNSFCNPENFHGSKTEKRDFQNWQNGAKTMFKRLEQTGDFQLDCNENLQMKASYGL